MPEKLHKDYRRLAPTLPRAPAGHYQEWVSACKGGPAPRSNFDFAGPLTEAVLLGMVCVRNGGSRLSWDSQAFKTSDPDANQYLHYEYRKGWNSELYPAVAVRAAETFDRGFNCAESVLVAVAEHYGIVSDQVPAMASAFGSGLSRTCNLCGAVTGGVMAIGLLLGRRDPGQTTDAAYGATRQFLAGFQSRFNSTNCLELTQCRLDTAEGRAAFKAQNVRVRCREYTGVAAALATAAIEGFR